MRSGNLLVMDNNRKALDDWSSYLQDAGYNVVKAASLEEARELLRTKWIHLAIFDIRMMDDDDENDISGLLLAQDPEFRTVPKIVLTGFASFEYARLVLAADKDGNRAGINFIAKKEKPRKLLEAIEQALVTEIHIKADLEIQTDPDDPVTFSHLSQIMEPDLGDEERQQRADELEDLVRQVFFDYETIRLDKPFWRQGFRFCLPVLARTSSNTTDYRLYVCGKREWARENRRKLETLAPKAAHETKFSGAGQTMHFGANLYELPGGDTSNVQTLRDLFLTGKERNLRTALDRLCGQVLNAWHGHGQALQDTGDLLAVYRQWVGLDEKGLDRKAVEQQLERLIQSARQVEVSDIQHKDGQVTYLFPHEPAQEFPDPVATVYSTLAEYRSPIICKNSPGFLNAYNVLVGGDQRPWLTDFASAGQAPQWWDFVCLEASIRFDLGKASDLHSWQEFEKCLVSPTRLDEKLNEADVATELRTSVELIEQIRQQAASEIGPDPLPYFAGLLAFAVKGIASFDPRKLKKRAETLTDGHILLAACMLARRLGTTRDIALPEGRLRLDPDGSVRIGERRVAQLTGLSEKLLACLFESAGQVVNYRSIIEAYGETYDESGIGQQERVRQEVSRLRDAIEPDPAHPRYIITVRSKGYRLNPEGESK